MSTNAPRTASTLNRRTFVIGAGAALAALAGTTLLGRGYAQADSAAKDAAASAAADGSRTVTDLAGNTVTLPEEVDSVVITSWKGALEVFALLGHLDLVKGMSDTSRYVWLRQIHPELVDVPDFGNFDDVNVEEILAAQPDIIFAPEAGPDAIAKMQEIGLPVYVDGVTVTGDPYEGFHEELEAIAEIVGEEERAAELEEWEQKWLDEVAERVADIPEDERKRCIVMRNNTTELFNCKNILGLSVENAGGINLAKDTITEKFFGDVDAEQVLQWNPDFIFQHRVGSSVEELEARYQEMADDPVFSGITAVQNGDYYVMPYGLVNWGGKIESALGALTMAKTMYPDLFEDVVIKDVAEEFYKKFLDRELTDEDWDTIVVHSEGANDLPLE